MRVVIALGGNALLRRGEALTAEIQRHNVERAALAIARVVRAGHEVLVTHGNGPQVGLMALQDAAYDPTSASPLDVLCAESEGMIGYLIVQALQNALGSMKQVAALLTRIVVDPDDPAFAVPTKPIGPLYDAAQSEELAATYGWVMMADGDRFRRAVASPRPLRIVELDTIRRLAEAGTLVVCAGGGGIPVVMAEDGACRGIEAVIDKDHASRLLALAMGAEALLLLTDVDGLYAGWGGPDSRLLERPRLEELRAMSFAAGTMGPKVAAAIDFIAGGGRLAGIGRLEDAGDILEDRAGTRIAGVLPET